ncbi:MAG: hypothetical protein A2020_10605 [Lentisphaerae bacterium GWF2_45_14]|nr:MAG: hypothetical protein A2020_10605 [Lentisphaerae bacterium GWF2_45_14]
MIMHAENSEIQEALADICAEAAAFFAPSSPLKEAVKHGGRPFEFRKQQSEMAEAVANALQSGENLCVEAPTGIGKSFAYLVPSILFAVKQKLPVLITTETINLQEQLIEKDIPILRKLLGIDFAAALAKGRSNYTCKRRLSIASGGAAFDLVPNTAVLSEIERISKWADKSPDGSLSGVDFRISQQAWSSVCCEGGNCAGPKCGQFRECFYWKARREWDKADILIANHALFFTDLKIKQNEEKLETLLPAYSAVIIDEAHTLEDNAAEYMGLNISSSSMHYFLSRLYNPENGKGLLVRKGEKILELRKKVAGLIDKSRAFFALFDNILLEQDDSVLRLRQPPAVPDIISQDLDKLASMIDEYARDDEGDKDFKIELASHSERARAFCEGIYQFLGMSLDEHVYWIEKETQRISLYAAPLNVSEILGKYLFSGKFPVILTSATLTVNKNLAYFKERTGFRGGPEKILDTPFNYKEQAAIYISKHMPEPNETGYLDAAVSEIEKYIKMTHGKAFVLFTSYQMLKSCAEILQGFFDEFGINLLVQGEDLTRSAMLNRFKEDTNSVIFGTTSFWTGVDVPGEALSNVIITKLPFSVPSHPLITARSERIEREGRSSFMHYSLPEAVLRFRQGTGRLIRSSNDRGIIVILDRRIISKKYGRTFLNSIPECKVNIC